jgi:hypothetical protein
VKEGSLPAELTVAVTIELLRARRRDMYFGRELAEVLYRLLAPVVCTEDRAAEVDDGASKLDVEGGSDDLAHAGIVAQR